MNVIWFVPCPPVMAPFPIVHAYVDPAWAGTLAMWFGEPAPTVAGAVMTGIAGEGLTVTRALPVATPEPFVSDTAVTVYVVVTAGLTLRVAGLVSRPDCVTESDHVIDLSRRDQ